MPIGARNPMMPRESLPSELELADVGNLFGVPLHHDLVAASQAAQQTELNTLYLFADTLPTIARLRRSGIRVGICSNAHHLMATQ
jgi:hypothetical protein